MLRSMANSSTFGRAVTCIAFSLIVTVLLGFGGLLLGWYSWAYFGPETSDLDEIVAYSFGLLLGAVIGLAGGAASLWKFWPRNTPQKGMVIRQASRQGTDILMY